jgi:hypothetical protein
MNSRISSYDSKAQSRAPVPWPWVLIRGTELSAHSWHVALDTGTRLGFLKSRISHEQLSHLWPPKVEIFACGVGRDKKCRPL